MAQVKEKIMQAKDVMNRTVITVRPHMAVDAAAALLVTHGVTSAPVVTAEGMLRGIVSEADLLRAWPMSDIPRALTEPTITAADVMTPEPVTVQPTDELVDVAAVLLDRGIRAAPVVEGRRLVGIISRHDVLSCIVRQRTGPACGRRPVAASA
jgi:CBS domain-containing protein